MANQAFRSPWVGFLVPELSERLEHGLGPTAENSSTRHEMNYFRLCSTLTHSLSSTLGVVFNLLLIFLVLKNTPKQLRTYSILILNFALCEFLTCLADLLLQPRIIGTGVGAFLIPYGPCILMGTQTCFVIHSFALHCYAHALWSLLFSFSYRFYVLKRTPPRNRTIVAIIFVIYIPSFLQFMTFSFANDDEDELKTIIEQKFGYDMHSEHVAGFKNFLGWKSLPGILHITLPVAPVYVAILVLRKLTISILSRGMVMSESNKRLHSQLLKALTIQACLPILFLLAVIVYAVEQLDIYHHPALEFSIFMMSSLIPMLSPLTSFIFIRPYNVWIKKKLLRRPNMFSSIKISTITSKARISDPNVEL
uniref:G protein-coupled receptor n=1 Tax=Haemonchus contortus TaxID=6289 RepID=A0A7I4YWA2_HAECO